MCVCLLHAHSGVKVQLFWHHIPPRLLHRCQKHFVWAILPRPSDETSHGAGVCFPPEIIVIIYIYTFREKTIIINYKSVARLFQRHARVRCGCEKTNTLSGLSVRRDGVWTTSSPLFFCFRGRCLRFLMKCRPFRMRTQWGVESGPLHPSPCLFFCLFLPLLSVHLNLLYPSSFKGLE